MLRRLLLNLGCEAGDRQSWRRDLEREREREVKMWMGQTVTPLQEVSSDVRVTSWIPLKNTKLASLGVHGYYLYITLRATSAHVIVPLA